MRPVTTDPWQLRDALAGDEAAWRRLVEEFNTQIWQWARACGLNRDDAYDVVQNVWYKLKDRGYSIDDPARLPGWLATTTRREAISLHRRLGRNLVTDEADFSDRREPSASVDQLAEANVLKDELAAAFASLGETCRQLLSLCWSGTLSYEEIAEILGRSVGYIGPTRQRCLNTLRARAGIT